MLAKLDLWEWPYENVLRAKKQEETVLWETEDNYNNKLYSSIKYREM